MVHQVRREEQASGRRDYARVAWLATARRGEGLSGPLGPVGA